MELAMLLPQQRMCDADAKTHVYYLQGHANLKQKLKSPIGAVRQGRA